MLKRADVVDAGDVSDHSNKHLDVFYTGKLNIYLEYLLFCCVGFTASQTNGVNFFKGYIQASPCVFLLDFTSVNVQVCIEP